MPAAYVNPSVDDDDSLVPLMTTSEQDESTTGSANKQPSSTGHQKDKAQTTAMEHPVTGATLRRKDDAEAEEEEAIELDSFVKEGGHAEAIDEPQVLARKDVGNFILLVVLCKWTCISIRVGAGLMS